MPDYIDIHCHPNFSLYDQDRDEVLGRMRNERVWGICVGTDLETSRQSVLLAQNNKNIFATVGLHPTDVDQGFPYGDFFKLADREEVVAIGECGLDYYRKDGTPEEKIKQQNVLQKQFYLARELSLPLMIHCRPSAGTMDAYEDLIGMIRLEMKNTLFGYTPHGNIHFFVGDSNVADQLLDLGFTFSFTGVITFTHDYDEVIRLLPLSKILSETDSPFVAPLPFRGQRNEPVHVKSVIRRIAEIKELPEEEVRRDLRDNAFRSFGFQKMA